jgi:MinD-like ATPase involved in chromosome partitioning or flagellar assembly
MIELRLVTLAGDPDREAELARELSSRRDVDLVLRCVDRVELLGALRSGTVDAIVSVGAPLWFDRQEAFEAAESGIVVVGLVADPMDADRLANLGASLVPANAGIDEVLARCRETDPVSVAPLAADSLESQGRLIAVWGPKGAPGRTRVAVELAAELASSQPSTLLVDADPYGGDVLQILGIVDELASIVWAARLAARGELDEARFATELRRAGENGPIVLPGLPRAELWADISEFGWRALLQRATASFQFTVCDAGFCIEGDTGPYPTTGYDRNRIAREAIRSADMVVAVCRGDPVGLKNFVWAFEQLRELAGIDSVAVVANRVRRGEEREVSEILKRHIGVRPIAAVPDIPGDIHRALLAGKSLREAGLNAATSEAVRKIVSSIGGRVPARGLLTRLAGRT